MRSGRQGLAGASRAVCFCSRIGCAAPSPSARRQCRCSCKPTNAAGHAVIPPPAVCDDAASAARSLHLVVQLAHRRGVEFSTTDPASLKAGNVSCRRQTLPLAGAVCRATALFESSVHSQLPWLSPSSLPYTSVASICTHANTVDPCGVSATARRSDQVLVVGSERQPVAPEMGANRRAEATWLARSAMRLFASIAA